MCYVQRVLNTCGHKNDHVLLTCHLARRVLPPLESAPSSSACRQAGQSHPQPQPQHQKQPGISLSITEVEVVIARTGFHACSQPYCIFARIRELESPMGFKCMVEGCVRAD